MKYSDFKKSCVRSDASANDVTHFFSRWFAVPAAYLCFRLGLSPNQVTGLFLLFGVLSGVTLYLGMGLAAYLFWRLHMILDMADGSLARATKLFSPNAVGFDRSNHIVINTTILLAPIVSFGSIAMANVLTASFFLHYFFYRNYSKEKGETQQLSLFVSFVRHALGIEGYVAVNVLLVIASLERYALYVAAVYSMFFMLLFFIKLYRQIRP